MTSSASDIIARQAEGVMNCPFCGAVASVSSYRLEDYDPEYWVGCDTDRCPGDNDSQCFDTEAEAIAAWNRRAPTQSERIEALKAALRPFAFAARNIPPEKQDKDVTRVVMDEILSAEDMADFAKRGAPLRSPNAELIISIDGLRAKDFRRARTIIDGGKL